MYMNYRIYIDEYTYMSIYISSIFSYAYISNQKTAVANA